MGRREPGALETGILMALIMGTACGLGYLGLTGIWVDSVSRIAFDELRARWLGAEGVRVAQEMRERRVPSSATGAAVVSPVTLKSAETSHRMDTLPSPSIYPVTPEANERREEELRRKAEEEAERAAHEQTHQEISGQSALPNPFQTVIEGEAGSTPIPTAPPIEATPEFRPDEQVF